MKKFHWCLRFYMEPLMLIKTVLSEHSWLGKRHLNWLKYEEDSQGFHKHTSIFILNSRNDWRTMWRKEEKIEIKMLIWGSHVVRTFGEPLGNLLKTHPEIGLLVCASRASKACWDSFYILRENKKETDAHILKRAGSVEFAGRGTNDARCVA